MALQLTAFGRSGMINSFLAVTPGPNAIAVPDGASVIGIHLSSAATVVFRLNGEASNTPLTLNGGGIHYIADITHVISVTGGAAVTLALVKD